MFNKIHIIDRKMFLDPPRPETQQVRMWMKRSQRKCVKQAEKFNGTSSASNSATVNTITIGSVDADEISSDEKEIIILNHFIKATVFSLFAAAAKKPEPSAKKAVKNIIKNVLNKKIDKKKNLPRPKTLRGGRWKPVTTEKNPPSDMKKMKVEDPPHVETEKFKISMMIPDIETVLAEKKRLEQAQKKIVVDHTVPSKVRKPRAPPKPKLTDIWKSAEDSDDLMKKIRDAQITLTMKELIAYAPAAHKLFTRGLSEEQITKLTVRSLEVNMKKKGIDSWYSCANPRVLAVLKSRVRIQALLNSDAEINLMSADIQKNLRFTMHALSVKLLISSQTGHALNFIEVCSHVKMRIGELSTYHHIFVVDSSNHFFVLRQFFFAAVFINYDYRNDEIYVICTNSKFTRSAVFKIMNRYDKQNKNKFMMYDYSAILKKSAATL